MDTLYFDTCIVSGIAKQDVKEKDLEALEEILILSQESNLKLLVTDAVQEELNKIPETFRKIHNMIFSLLPKVERAHTHKMNTRLMLMGFGGGIRKDPLLKDLENLLPDKEDALHIFQACKNQANIFLTVDENSIVKYSEDIQNTCNIRAFTPHGYIYNKRDKNT